MSELRVVGLKFEVETEAGKTKIVQMRRALSDADATVKMLNDTLGDNVTVSTTKVQTDKEVAAQARLLITQQERQRKKVEQVVDQYTLLNTVTAKYGENSEVVNAVVRLGSNATDEQREKVASLVTQYQAMRNQGDAASDSMRNMRGIAQNLGWQLQDVVVQAQMGTDAFIILSQQGSQFAAAFGPIGAIVGAGIAIAGAAIPALISYLSDAEDSTDALTEASERLNDVFDSGKYSVDGFSDELQRLYEIDSKLAELKLLNVMLDAEQVMKSSAENIKDVASDLSDLGDGFRWAGTRAEAWQDDLEDVAESLGINVDQVKNLETAYKYLNNTGDPSKLVSAMKDITLNSPGATSELKRLALQVSEAGIQSEQAQVKLDKIKELMDGGLTSSTIGLTSSMLDQVDAWTDKTIALDQNERQQAIWNATLSEGVEVGTKEYELLVKSIDTYYDRKDALEAITEAQKKANEARKESEKLLDGIYDEIESWTDKALAVGLSSRQQAINNAITQEGVKAGTKEYDLLINSINAYYDRKDALDAATEAQKKANEVQKEEADAHAEIEALIKSYENKRKALDLDARQQAINNEMSKLSKYATEAEKEAITDSINAYYKRKNAIDAEVDARKAQEDAIKNVDKLEKSYGGQQDTGNPIIDEQNQHNDALKELYAARDALQQEDYANRQRVNALVEKEVERHRDALIEAEYELASNQVSVLSNTTSFMSDITDTLVDGAEEVATAMEEMNGIQQAMFIVNRSMAAAEAVINGITLGSKLAALYGNPALQTVGTALGAANAGAIMGTTFAGAFDDGGYIPAGSTGIVSEYGDELVNGQLVTGPARVTSREDTAKMMNKSMNVTVNNNASGVEHSVNQIDENTVEIIANRVFGKNIDKGVAGVLSKKGSKADRAMRSSYQGGARKY